MGKALIVMGWYSESSSLNFRVSLDKEASIELSQKKGGKAVYVMFLRGKFVVPSHIYRVCSATPSNVLCALWVVTLIFTNTPWGHHYYHPHFTDEKTEAQGSYKTCPRSHSLNMAEVRLRLEPRQLSIRMAMFHFLAKQNILLPKRCLHRCRVFSQTLRIKKGKYLC